MLCYSQAKMWNSINKEGIKKTVRYDRGKDFLITQKWMDKKSRFKAMAKKIS